MTSIQNIKKNLFHTCYVGWDIAKSSFKISIPTKKESEQKVEEGLNNLKKLIKKIKKKRASKYIDRLAFLFKRDEYVYENEYRISKSLTTNDEITIENRENKYFIYTYLSEEPLSYSEVILGPNNTQNINYIGEYVKLLNPSIKVKESKISYR